MNNKYYTPDPEEFCIGFEYESLQDERFPDEDNSWEKNIISDEWHLRRFLGYYCDDHIEIRTKHLDREDIESFGFKYGLKLRCYMNPICYMKKVGYGYFWINATQNNKVIIYHSLNNMGERASIRFSGTIKNKSVLKQVLKMIGV